MTSSSSQTTQYAPLNPAEVSYMIESAIYAFAMVLGCGAFVYTARRFHSNYRRHVIIAARLMSFKISLTIADLIVLFIYAPTQIIWISTYYWYGGDVLCRTTKFIGTFSLHLTANVQVLIAVDRLYITAHLRKPHQRAQCTANHMILTAWLLAIACALPQLVVFHASTDTPFGEPQCVSIWTIMRYHHHMSELMNGGDWNNSVYSVIHRSMADPVDVNYEYNPTLQFLEHAYNVLHLLSIYIIPYTIELFCYAAILVMMRNLHREARRESGSGTKTMTITLPTDCASASDNKSLIGRIESGELFIFKSKQRAPSLDMTKKAGPKKLSRRIYGSLPSTGGLYRSNATYCSRGDVPPSHGTRAPESSFELEMQENRFVPTIQEGESKSAWQVTMSTARRRTRTKAFLMLTLNMVFWTPYCVLGIISTLTVFDHSAYDFVNAFIVLNAVSNLLL